MSKRTRGSARVHRRPGARPPTNRPAGERPSRPSTAQPSPGATDVSPIEAAVASVEREHRNDQAERSVVAAERQPVRSTQHRPRAKPGSLLAARAATEYVYVGQDLRRILFVSAILLAVMLAAWLAIAVFRIIPLDFY